MKYDLIIIGGGPGGYQAALTGAQSGLKTALVEAADLGGTCLNRGCIPTKLLLGATSVLPEIQSQKRLRLVQGDVSFDLPRIQNRKKSIISASQKAMLSRLEKLGADIYMGHGSLDTNRTVKIDSSTLGYDKLILATGSKSGSPADMEPDHDNILTSTDALALEEVPDSLAVIGAGPVGLEIGQIFSRLGSRIILIEALDRIAPLEDEQVSLELSKYLRREKWDILTGVKVVGIDHREGRLAIHLDSKDAIESSKCLLALGRTPATSGLNLEAAGIEVYGAGWIKTDSFLQATPDIYAVGDVNGRAMYAHAASHQAEYAVKHLLGNSDTPYQGDSVPSCVYGSMEVIRAGMTHRELALGDRDFSFTSTPLAANPIAQAHGQVQGFIKVLWCEGRVAGITGVGHGVSGLITLAQVICHEGWTREDVKKYIFAHPTLDEALQEALLGS